MRLKPHKEFLELSLPDWLVDVTNLSRPMWTHLGMLY